MGEDAGTRQDHEIAAVAEPNRLLRAIRERTPSRRTPGCCMSREELAEAVGRWLSEHDPKGREYAFDAGHLGKIERGIVRRPRPHYVAALCAVLGATETELGLSRGGWPITASPAHEAAAQEPGIPSAANTPAPHTDELFSLVVANLALFAASHGTTPQGNETDENLTHLHRLVEIMNRRGLLQLLGLTATTTMASPLVSNLHPDHLDRVISAVAAPGRVDENVVAHIEEVLTSARANDSRLGPQAAFPVVLAQCDLIPKMLPECPDQLRPRLLSALSNAFRLAGWLSFDSNDFTNAWRYYERARATAHDAQDPEITAFILANMSHVATWTGKRHAALDHAMAAQTWAAKTENLPVQAFASDRAAVACAAAGDYDQCMRELDRADVSVASLSTRSFPSPYYYNDALHAARRGESLLRLGRTPDAINVINESLALYDPSSVRDIAIGKLNLVKAHIQSTDIDEAAKVVATVADLATQNRSARLIKELRTTREAMRPWQETKPVKQLDDHLAGYGLG